MSLLSSLKDLLVAFNFFEDSIKTGFRFSQKEIKEIVAVSRKENLKYFEILAKMPNLKYFDISFLLSQTELNDERIAIIEEAQKMYNDEEFRANGQTRSDFIFRVAANFEYLNLENIEVFKELVKCKNELYDFGSALQHPLDYLVVKEKKVGFAFQNVYTDC